MFTSKPPTCAGRTLALPRKDRDIRYLRHLGNSDIAPLYTRRSPSPGASVIKCCYAATGMYMTAAAAILRELASVSTSLSDETRLRRDTKMSRRVSRRVASPACIAGVRISRPNFSGHGVERSCSSSAAVRGAPRACPSTAHGRASVLTGRPNSAGWSDSTVR